MRHSARVTWDIQLIHLSNAKQGCEVLTAGLKSPPLILKNIQAFTPNENPKTRAMYRSADGFGFGWEPGGGGGVLATWAAENAKNRKRNVPTNSPVMATKWLRALFGRICTRVEVVEEVARRLKPDKAIMII
jgi:hypothetical protein